MTAAVSVAGPVYSVNRACESDAIVDCINQAFEVHHRTNSNNPYKGPYKLAYQTYGTGLNESSNNNPHYWRPTSALAEGCASPLNLRLKDCQVVAEVPTAEQTQKMIDDMKKSFAEEIAKVLEKQRDEVANLINGAKKE
jgi:hypothetical protein